VRPGSTATIAALAIALAAATAAVPSTAVLDDEGEDCPPHPPIRITQDEGPQGFALANPAGEAPVYRPGSGVTSGSGTAEDPYVIEGWCIQALGGVATSDMSTGIADAGIAIEDTSAHVVVRDNVIAPPEADAGQAQLQAANEGIRVQGAANVAIEANEIRGAQERGVLVENAETVDLVNNEIHDHESWAGVYLDRASDVTIRGNDVHDNVDFDDVYFAQAGILLHNARDNRITDNHVHDNMEAGIILSGESTDNRIADNLLEDNDGEGIRIGEEPHHESHRATIEANEVHDRVGIAVNAASQAATIRANSVHGNGEGRGIFVQGDQATIEANHVQHALPAIRVDGADAGIRDNDLDQVRRAGIQLSYARNAHVAGNAMDAGGVLLQGFDGRDFVHDIEPSNTIGDDPIVHVHDAENRTVDADAGQVLVTHSRNVTVQDQTIQDAAVGVQIVHSNDTVVENTEVIDPRWHGVEATYGAGLTVEDVHVQAPGSDGIEVRRLDQTHVRASTVADSQRFGVHLYDSANSSVEETTVTNSEYEGVRFWLSPSATVNQTIADDNGRLGIRVSGDGAAVIANNSARNNGYRGIVVSGVEDAVVRDNEATGNADEGIRLGSADAELRGNNLADNGVGVGQWNSEPVDARHNWWGCQQGPTHSACDDAYDGVDYDPWLTSPNPDAGADR
jgi:parallel beta-helix repeat protein